jgi:hypothetical protein
MGVSGIIALVRQLLRQASWTFCSGHMRTAVHGILGLAYERQEEVTLSCCSGRGRRGVPGMQTQYVDLQHTMDMWRLCSGWKNRWALEQGSTMLVQCREPRFCAVSEKRHCWHFGDGDSATGQPQLHISGCALFLTTTGGNWLAYGGV